MRMHVRRGTKAHINKLLFTGMAVFALLVQPAYAFVASQVAAAAAPISISNAAELRDAIRNQADGQTWSIAPGSYAVTPIDDYTAGGQTGWYLPITANNITISGVGNPTLYGDGFTPNGAWSKQDFVAIFGNNVTIKNLTIMSKVAANKAVEVMGNNSTIENVAIKYNSKVDPAVYGMTDPEMKQWSGSILYNDENTYAPGAQTNHTLKDVTIDNGGVSLSYTNSAVTLTANNLHFVYKSNVNWVNEYRLYNPHGATINGVPQYTYQVSHALNNIEMALDNVAHPDSVPGVETIKLISDLWTNHQINITKPNVTIDGKKACAGCGSYQIAGTFDKPTVNGNNNNAVLSVKANGVRINDLIVNGQNHQLHGINTYEVTDLQLQRVTVKNNKFSGLNVNRSSVTVTDLTTENNGWHGVDVDKAGAVLTVNGTSSHTETVPYIYVDDRTVGQVIDTNNQYGITDNVLRAGDRVYGPKDTTAPTTPTITAPGANTWHNTTPIINSWTAATDDSGIAKYQVAYRYHDDYSFGGSTCAGEVIAGKNVYCRDTTGLSRNHMPATSEQGGVTIWVRAVDTAGNVGSWSAPRTYFYDATAPTTDINVSTPVNGTFTVSGDASDNLRLNRVYVQLVSRVTNQRCGGTTVSFVADNTNTKSWSVSYDLATLGANCPAGNFAAHVEVVDMAGNRGTAGWTDNFLVEAPIVDTTAPVIEIAGYDDDLEGVPALFGTVDDPDAVVEVTLDGVTYSSTNGDVIVYTDPDNPSLTVWVLILDAPLAPGLHTVFAVARDAAGNESTDSQAFTIEAPVIPQPVQPTPSQPLSPVVTPAQIAAQVVTQTTTEESDKAGEVLGDSDIQVDSPSSNKGEVLGDNDVRKEWSLVNVILAGVAVLMTLIALAGIRKDGESKAKVLRVVTLVPAVAAVVVVLLTEDFSAKLGWFNLWTILFAGIVAVQAILMASAKTSK